MALSQNTNFSRTASRRIPPFGQQRSYFRQAGSPERRPVLLQNTKSSEKSTQQRTKVFLLILSRGKHIKHFLNNPKESQNLPDVDDVWLSLASHWACAHKPPPESTLSIDRHCETRTPSGDGSGGLEVPGRISSVQQRRNPCKSIILKYSVRTHFF